MQFGSVASGATEGLPLTVTNVGLSGNSHRADGDHGEIDDHPHFPPKAVYKLCSQVAEFSFAWIKEKLGLRRFDVRGLIRTGREVLWVCLTFNNIQAWIRFRSRTAVADAG